jgi:hypothetical protein
MSKLLVSSALAAGLALGLAAGEARAALFYVDGTAPKASDQNPGSREAPWRTIRKAASVLEAGDTCFVMPGIYEERIAPANSGRDGGPITFKAVGQAVVRGFFLESRTHIRIIGFEITQTGSQNYPAVLLLAAHDCEILDNHIHHTSMIGIFFNKRAPSNGVVVRGNRMSHIGSVPGRELGQIAILVAGDGNRIEYNDISHVADFTNAWGEKNVFRNNFFHDNSLGDFPDFLVKNPPGHHIDGLQYYSDEVAPLKRTLMEANIIADNGVSNAHFVLMRNIHKHASSEFLFRRNVAVRNGAYAIMVESFPGLRVVHNTFVDMLYQMKVRPRYCIQIWNGSTGARILNNIFVRAARPDGITFMVDETSQPGFAAAGNLIFRSGRPAQRLGVYQDPLFASPGGDDYRLSHQSPAIDGGADLTTTTAAGAGTEVPVGDTGYFFAGTGPDEGEQIAIGSGPQVRVLGVDDRNKRVLIDREISWKAGEPVRYAFAGRAPDIGAYEFRPAAKAGEVVISAPEDGATVSGPLTVRAEAGDPVNVRFVVFSIDGIPVARITDPPYACSLDLSWAAPGEHALSATAYAREAAPAPTRTGAVRIRLSGVPAGRGS